VGGELGDASPCVAELAQWEREAATAVREYLAGQWAMRARGLAPPPPRELVAPERRRRVQTARSRRERVLWRWYAFAEVEGEPAVATAFGVWRRSPGPRTLAALFHARSRVARRMGFTDYAALARARDEIDDASLAWGRTALAAAKPGSAPPAWRPPALGAATDVGAIVGEVLARLSALGFDVANVTVDADAGLRAAGRCFAVAPPRDVRVWVRAPIGVPLARALAHELGHAALARAAPASSPPLAGSASSRTIDEAVATAAEHAVTPVRWRARGRALTARAAFEASAYADPDQDLEALWRQLGGAGREPWRAGSYAALDPGAQGAYLVGTAVAQHLGRAGGERVPRLLAAAIRGSWKDAFDDVPL
jgi:hypothetical protein